MRTEEQVEVQDLSHTPATLEEKPKERDNTTESDPPLLIATVHEAPWVPLVFSLLLLTLLVLGYFLL